MVTLVGAVVRVPYTFAVAIFGGRNWTISPPRCCWSPRARGVRDGAGNLVHTFLVVACSAGIGGGNFASSMTNINAFFPAGRRAGRSGSTPAAATSASRSSS